MTEQAIWEEKLKALGKRIDTLNTEFGEFASNISLSLICANKTSETTLEVSIENLTRLIKASHQATYEKCCDLHAHMVTLLEELTGQILKISAQHNKM